MAEWLTSRSRRSRLCDCITLKSSSFVTDPQQNHTACSHVPDADPFLRIEAASVLHRVRQNFPQGDGNPLANVLGQITHQVVDQLQNAFPKPRLTIEAQADPVRCGG